MLFHQYYKKLRLSSFLATLFQACDRSTAEGRSQERFRRIALTSITSAAAQLVKIATPILAIPYVLGYLGTERFGLWMTVSSIIVMLNFSDLGLGNSLITALGRADGNSDHKGAQCLVSSAFAMLLGVSFILVALNIAFVPWMNWSFAFNAKSPAGVADAGSIVFFTLLCFALNLPFSIVQKIQAAYQEGFQSNLWQCLSSFLTMVAVLLAVYLDCGVEMLIVAFLGTPIIVTAANAFVFLGWRRDYLRPRLACCNKACMRDLLQSGGGFVAITLLTTVGFQCDNFILAHGDDLSAVAHYAVPFRLASVLCMVPMMIYQPLWAANSEALARGEANWVKAQTRRFQDISVLVTALGAVALVLLGPWVIHRWIGPDFPISRWLLAGLGLSPILYSIAGPWFMVLNAGGRIRFQVWMFAIFSALVIVVKMLAVKMVGVGGLPWANFVCYAVIVLPVLKVTVSRFLNDINA